MSEERFLLDAISKTGLTDNLIIGKTQEMLRKLSTKLPVGSLKKAEICRGFIAIEMACCSLNVPLDKVKLMAQVPITPKIYQEGLIKCKQVLKVQRDAEVTQKLAVHFGVNLKCLVQDTLGQYKMNYIDKLHPNQRVLVDINSAVCQAAAFYVVSVRSKVKLTRSEVASVAEVDVSHLITVTDMMTSIMKSEKNGGLNLNAATKRQKTVPNDIVPNKTICTALCSNINDASHTDKICQTLTNKTININGKDFKNHEFAHSESVPKSAESYLTSNVCQRLKINSLEAVNHKTDNVSLLRNKIHEEKLEHDQYVADRENKKNGVREKYDKWKEGLEKKRKLSVKSINSSRQPLCDFHSG